MAPAPPDRGVVVTPVPVRTRRELAVDIERWPLPTPFRIAGHVWDELPLLIVRLREGGCEGRGEAAGVYYFGDTPERMACQVEALRTESEHGLTREALQARLPPGGARNALDCAMWELEARQAGVPVHRLAGLPAPQPLVTTCTVGADSPTAMAVAARAYVGARALKLKLTGEAALDAERVRAVRAACPGTWLGVDANQGYTAAGIGPLLPVLADAQVSLLEQPFARGDEAAMRDIDWPLTVALDESVQSGADLESVAGLCDVVNIKLDKCGGLTEALNMLETLREMGMRAMVGNMLGTAWAMAPAWLVGQGCEVVDLDGPLLLAADRDPGVRYRDGRIDCPDAAWGGAGDAIRLRT